MDSGILNGIFKSIFVDSCPILNKSFFFLVKYDLLITNHPFKVDLFIELVDLAQNLNTVQESFRPLLTYSYFKL